MTSSYFNLINHISIGTNDLEGASAFYDAVFDTIHAKRQLEIPEIAVAYGINFPEFWVQTPSNQKPANSANGTHIALHVPSNSLVDAFYSTAIEKGAKDAGAPGFRPEYAESYYAAFIYDLDGHKIEVLHMPFESGTTTSQSSE